MAEITSRQNCQEFLVWAILHGEAIVKNTSVARQEVDSAAKTRRRSRAHRSKHIDAFSANSGSVPFLVVAIFRVNASSEIGSRKALTTGLKRGGIPAAP